MDNEQLEKVLLQIFAETGGTIKNEDLVASFPHLLEMEAKDEHRHQFKKVLGKIATMKTQGDTKIIVLKSKYRGQCGLSEEQCADGLQAAIWKALSTAASDSPLSTIPGPLCKSSSEESSVDPFPIADSNVSEEKNSGINVVLVNTGPDETEEDCMRHLTNSSSLSKMLAPLTKQEEQTMAGDEINVEKGNVSIDDGDNLDRESPLPVENESTSPQEPRLVQASASVPDLSHQPALNLTMSGSELDMTVISNSMVSPNLHHKMSVKDRARQYESDQDSPMSKSSWDGRPRSVNSSRSSRYSKQKDDCSDTYSNFSTSLTEQERQWLLVSSSVDYQEMCKMLRNQLELARLVNFVNGYTALHWAAKKGHLDAIKLLAGTYHADVNRKTHGGFTPLHMAAMHDKVDAMRLLTETYGANATLVDHSGRTPDKYLNNAYFTRKLTLTELAAAKSLTPNMARSYEYANGKSCSLVYGGVGLSDCLRTNGFGRMGSIRRAGTVALNLLRGQPSNRITNGSVPESPALEDADRISNGAA